MKRMIPNITITVTGLSERETKRCGELLRRVAVRRGWDVRCEITEGALSWGVLRVEGQCVAVFTGPELCIEWLEREVGSQCG